MILPIGKPRIAKNKGFTFIELILVAIIILILTGLSAPLFRRSFSGIQLKATCQDLIHLMRYAQAKSVAERKFTRLNFDFDQGLFWLSAEEEESSGKFERLQGRWGKIYTTPEAITVNSAGDLPEAEGNPYISFYPDGSSDKTEIKVSDGAGRTFSITTQRTIKYVEGAE